MNLPTATASRTIELDPGQLLSLEAPTGCIRLMHGQIWLTENGAARDSFLGAGDHWRLHDRPVLLGALVPSRLLLCGTAAGRQRRPAGVWRRLGAALQRQVQRLQFGPPEVSPRC